MGPATQAQSTHESLSLLFPLFLPEALPAFSPILALELEVTSEITCPPPHFMGWEGVSTEALGQTDLQAWLPSQSWPLSADPRAGNVGPALS